MNRRAVVALVLLAGCTAAGDTATSREMESGHSVTELEGEYRFEPYPGVRWYGPDGETRSSNVIHASLGPTHCGWDSAVLMTIAQSLGSKIDTPRDDRQYARDPEGVFERQWLLDEYDADAELPKRAEYTGYRTDFMELWLDPNHDEAAYLVFANHVEKWPRSDGHIACD